MALYAKQRHKGNKVGAVVMDLSEIKTSRRQKP